MNNPDEVIDQILDVLEDNECTMAEAISILEMLKYNILRAGENASQSEGYTIQ